MDQEYMNLFDMNVNLSKSAAGKLDQMKSEQVGMQ